MWTLFQFAIIFPGFTNPPVDHYWRPFTILEKLTKSGLCHGSQSAYTVMLDYVRDMWIKYSDKRGKFGFIFPDIPSHRNNNEMSMLDEELRDYLKKLVDDGLLDNTLLIVMADHGSRAGKVRASDQGKLEERLPFFTLRWVKQN